MTVWRLVVHSLLHHWRTNLSVALGVAAATAVLTGALLVGDAMRASLRSLALDRLGRIDDVVLANRFFREELAEELAASGGFREHFQEALPVVLLQTTVENPENGRRAGRVTTLGCDPQFWSLDRRSEARPPAPAGEHEIILNEPLADDLGVGKDGEVLVRVGPIGQIPADSPMGRKTESVQSRRLRVSALIPADGLGGFSLQINQRLPRVAFARRETLQSILGQHSKVNAVLVAGKSAGDVHLAAGSEVLQRFLRPGNPTAAAVGTEPLQRTGPTLADLGLSLKRVQVEHDGEAVIDYLQLTSDQLLLPPEAERAALTAFEPYRPQPALTYLANYILAGHGAAKIPYSTITAIDSNAALGPLVVGGKPLKLEDNEIVLNSWAADDLAAQGVALKQGDEIRITSFEPESTHGEERERTDSFHLRAVLPLAKPGQRAELTNDSGLTPETPGLTDKQSIENWDPPFTYDDKRVRTRPPHDQDEDYWRKYKLTPKAFVSLSAGRQLWGSRFGQSTSIRVPAGNGVTQQVLSDQLRSEIEPERLGFSLIPLRDRSLEGAEGTTSFAGLFLGFSFFIIAAAVMLVALLFRLGVEQRAGQIGLLLAVGLRRSRTGLLLASEGLMVAAAGALLGTALGVGYAWLMLIGLETWWLDAIVTPFLQLQFGAESWRSLAIGCVAGVVVSLLTIVWCLWSTRRSSIRRLLAGQAHELAGAGRRRRWRLTRVLAFLLLGVAAALAGLAMTLSGEAEAGAFFGSGAAVLTASLLLIWAQLAGRASDAAPSPTLVALVIRNVGRNPGRSTLTIGLVAAASFLIVAISAFQIDPSKQGAGGFDLTAESNQPLVHDLNTVSGLRETGFQDDEAARLSNAAVVSFRVKEGDDASCLNLYKPRQPRVLGAPRALIDRYSQQAGVHFAWAESAAATTEEKANPWLLLNKTFDNGAVAVVIDKNTALYAMHLFKFKGTGTEFEVDYDDGRTIRFRIVGLLSQSIFQGSLLISEPQFRQLFPEISGYRYFLIQSAERRSQETLDLLEERLGDQGFDAELASERLAELFAVQNTYLSTFRILGGLGLLLGTFGLATVQLRNVLERRGELALLRAAGFRRSRLAAMVMWENAVLLAGGLAAGVFAAVAAVLPHWLAGGAAIPLAGAAVMLLIVLVVGFASGFAAVRSTLRAPLLPALRGD